jgi:hypothetical protein
MAETISVAENGNLCGLLDVTNKFIRSARNDKINIAVLSEELGNDVAGCDELDG